MLKVITLICVILGLNCPLKSQDKTAIISGKISNSEETFVKISHTELDFDKKITIDSDGNFRDTLHFLEDANYFFSVGKSSSQLYLKDGYDLHLNFDATNVRNSIRFEGKGSDINNVSIELAKLKANLIVDSKDYFLVPLKDFNIANIKNKEKYLTLLNESLLSAKDKKLLSKVIENDYLSIHGNYDKFNFYHLKEHPVLPEDYYDKIQNINLDDEEQFFNDRNYRNLVIENYRISLNKAMQADTTLSKIAFVKNSTKDIKSIYIRESIISMLFNNVNNKNVNYYSDYEEIMAMLVSNRMKEKLNGRLQTAQSTPSGAKSVGFEYESYDGKKVSLADFKGKIVYIDIWATWCGPCIKQMPALKELIKEYEGKNIAFLVISVDDKKDFAKWKKMVPFYNVGGTHLISDNALNSEFMKAYSVGLIPRSILLDTNGNIINNIAPKPSDVNLKTILNQLLSTVKSIK
jgi:thiol-disulfide isomerase/thioredoxin